jgi:ubiquinone biosynthesis protein Coq4
MIDQNCLTSACRYCRFYQPEGLHRGTCQQLNVSVHNNWKACQLALPAFANTWENAEELTVAHWQEELPTVIYSSEELSPVSLELTGNSANVNN